MNGKDEFDVARELIRHEDGLVNNRVTWLLVLQGFLFNAFVGGVALLEKSKDDHKAVVCIVIGLILLGVVGIYSSLTAWNVVSIAYGQGGAVSRWWEKTGFSKNFPPLSGRLATENWFYWVCSTGRMPLVLAAVWILLGLLVLVGVA